MNAANLARDKRSAPYARAAMLMAGYNKAATWALALPPAERTVLLRYAKLRADADRVTDRQRKADAAELDKPAMDARIAAKKTRDDKKAADRQEIVDLARATRWADIIALSSTELLKQIKVYQVVEGNTSIVISRDASSRSARMLFLAELIASKYGEAQAAAGCTREHLYAMAQVKVSGAPRARKPCASRDAHDRPVRPRAAPPSRAGATKGAHAWRPASRARAARVGLDRHPRHAHRARAAAVQAAVGGGRERHHVGAVVGVCGVHEHDRRDARGGRRAQPRGRERPVRARKRRTRERAD